MLFFFYIYAFSRRFYPKRLTVHLGYTFFLSVHVLPGNRAHNLCAANAMLYHRNTGKCHGFSRFFMYELGVGDRDSLNRDRIVR